MNVSSPISDKPKRYSPVSLRPLFMVVVFFFSQGVCIASELWRPYECLVVQGKQCNQFLGADIDDLFVYAFNDKEWQQIPFQRQGIYLCKTGR